MRYARLKPEANDTFMHVYNRVAGSASDFPFGDVEKEEFIRRLTRLTEFYVIAVAAEREPFITRAARRVRYWGDGLVIGSELFFSSSRNVLKSGAGRGTLLRRSIGVLA